MQGLTDSGIALEFLHAAFSVDARVSDFELSESSAKHVQEISKLRKDNGLRTRVIRTEEEDVTGQSIDLGAEGALNLHILYLAQYSAADARIDREGRSIQGDLQPFRLSFFLHRQLLRLVTRNTLAVLYTTFKVTPRTLSGGNHSGTNASCTSDNSYEHSTTDGGTPCSRNVRMM